jgi:hypothetical protein
MLASLAPLIYIVRNADLKYVAKIMKKETTTKEEKPEKL